MLPSSASITRIGAPSRSAPEDDTSRQIHLFATNAGAKWMSLRDNKDEGLHRYTFQLKIRHDRVDEGGRFRK
jgi:hypothetical protein